MAFKLLLTEGKRCRQSQTTSNRGAESHGSQGFGIAGLPKQRNLRGPWSILTRALFLWAITPYGKEVISMPFWGRCPLHRDSEDIAMGKGQGHCDLDAGQTICDGDNQFCEKPDALRNYLSKKNEKGEVFKKERVEQFLRNHRLWI